jgi:regulator of RNase E activity RraA
MPVPDFADLSTSVVSDVLRMGGLAHRALSSRIARIASDRKVAGPAYCVRGESALGASVPDSLGGIRFEMYRRMLPGSVLLIGAGGYDEAAVFGEIMALAVKARGCVGVVTDGGVRRREAIARIDLAVYGSFSTPVSAAGRWRLVELDEPVCMPGQTTAQVLVNPGDWLVGDCDGVVVVPAEHAADVARDASVLTAVERARYADLAAGDDPEKVMQAMDRFGHIRRHAMGVFA